MSNSLAWDLEKTNTSLIEEKDKKDYEENIIFARCFATPDGKYILDWLIKHTLDTPTWLPLQERDKAIDNAFFREGQNNLVRQIKAKISHAKNYKPKIKE